SDNLYHISFSKLNINIFTGKAILENIRLTPDTILFRRHYNYLPPQVFAGTAKSLLLTNIHFLKYLLGKKIEIGQIDLVNPTVSVRVYGKKSSDREQKT